MAEAHSAVAFSFRVTHEGWDVDFDREVLHLVWASGVRSWKKRIARFKNSIKSGVFPASFRSLWATVAVVAGCHFYDFKVPYVKYIIALFPEKNVKTELIACSGLSMAAWLGVSFSLRYTLKMLFMYKGWMYEERGSGRKISLPTKLWTVAVKIFSGPVRPMLYSFQGSLPRLPLPSVADTMQRYLRSVRPLLDDAEYARMQKLALEFQNGIGKKLQRYLVLKSWWSTNYVSDWWEEYVYLRGRSPLVINSNFYGIDAVLMHPTTNQAARAAMVIYSLLQFRRLIERQELEPILIQGLVPLCSWQYERVFNTTRVPGRETDKIVHYSDSKHIVVYHRGRYFRVPIYHGGRLLQPCDIEAQLQEILNDKSVPMDGEERVAALTATDRTTWANARFDYFIKGTNRQSLDAIEKAAFMVSLDDVPFEFDEKDPHKLDNYGRNLLHGNGYNRWFDKSFTLCVGSNGRIGFNAEHSWADAAIMSHLWEHVIAEQAQKQWADAPVLGHAWENVLANDLIVGYDDSGHTLGTPAFRPPKPVRLQWSFSPDCLKTIDEAVHTAEKVISDVDLSIYMHSAYGKGFMKQCRVSPDAYIQLALQLAYFRDAGKFNLTYEASMTRLFREGRTETVRPCTIESCAWVRSMDNSKLTANEKVELMGKACQQHQLGYQDAMCGKGIDRHLFCLYVISKYLEVDSPFLKEVLSEPWRLSTSQTPHGQTSKLDLRKYPKCISAGGGFGPVADDGYGVSYIIAGEDLIFFHVSSKKSSSVTDSSRFAKKISEALNDVKKLFIEWKSQQKKNK